jgi:hypothetical protein
MDKNTGAYAFMQDAQGRKYFDSLPVFVQESIMQSGTQPSSLAELRQFAENVLEHWDLDIE